MAMSHAAALADTLHVNVFAYEYVATLVEGVVTEAFSSFFRPFVCLAERWAR